MMSRRLFVTVFCLLAACEKNDSKDEKSLRQQNESLAAENQALQNELAAAKVQTSQGSPVNPTPQTDNPALADTPSVPDLQQQIETLRTEVAKKDVLLVEQTSRVEILQGVVAEKSEDLLGLYVASIKPYAGIWVMDPKPTLEFADCEFMVRFEAESGQIYRAAVCPDGKMQADVQTVSGFSANNAAGWAGTLGFSIGGQGLKSSCGENVSVFPSGSLYAFDHSMSTPSPSGEAAFFMTSSMGENLKNFKSGSAVPGFGKTKSCEAILTRADLPSQAGNVLLQEAAKVCRLTPELSGVGCFTANDVYSPGT